MANNSRYMRPYSVIVENVPTYVVDGNTVGISSTWLKLALEDFYPTMKVHACWKHPTFYGRYIVEFGLGPKEFLNAYSLHQHFWLMGKGKNDWLIDTPRVGLYGWIVKEEDDRLLMGFRTKCDPWVVDAGLEEQAKALEDITESERVYGHLEACKKAAHAASGAV